MIPLTAQESMARSNSIRFGRLSFLLLVAGCISVTPQQSSTDTPDQVQVSTTTNSLMPTEACVSLNEDLPNRDLSGTAVFAGEGYSDAFLYKLRTGEFEAVPKQNNEALTDFFVSPDGNLLVYSVRNFGNTIWKIIIQTSSGEIVYAAVAEKTWRNVVGWLDDQNLIITNSRGGLELDNLMIFNPFTGASTDLTVSLPDIWVDYPLPTWENYSFSETVFDPTLDYVVFPRASGDPYFSRQVVLWNLSTNKPVAAILRSSFFGKTPRWSPRGDQFLINAPLQSTTDDGFNDEKEELFLVDKEGQISRLTFLTAYFDQVKIGFSSWAPSGSYVAFWVRINSNEKEELMLVDSHNLAVTTLCVYGREGLSLPPIWSNDGRFILVESSNDTVTGPLLIDLELMEAQTIGVGLSPVGWLASLQ